MRTRYDRYSRIKYGVRGLDRTCNEAYSQGFRILKRKKPPLSNSSLNTLEVAEVINFINKFVSSDGQKKWWMAFVDNLRTFVLMFQ